MESSGHTALEPIGRHEERDADIAQIVRFGLTLIVTILIVCGLSLWLLRILPARSPAPTMPSIVQLHSRVMPPEPRLQMNAPADLAKLHATEDAVLNSYGWVDKGEGIVRIPIRRAMDLLAERGLPPRESVGVKPSGR